MPERYFRENYIFDIIPLSGEKHTAEFIEDKLVKSIPILELSRSRTLTVDGASNLKKMCEEMTKRRQA
ncbi:unnamed protein product [Auanema sp. JU1783]|nr:unnamed protein product [Auanema sp. JU1783]